jgi:hypothetical protein
MSVGAILNYLAQGFVVSLGKGLEMIAEKNYEGAWVVSDIVNGYRVSRRYYYYTKREALAMFRREVLANA